MDAVTVRIENVYSDNHTSEATVQVSAPTGPPDDTWWNRTVFEHTGDGHGAGAYLTSHHTATIITAADPQLVGLFFEWTDS